MKKRGKGLVQIEKMNKKNTEGWEKEKKDGNLGKQRQKTKGTRIETVTKAQRESWSLRETDFSLKSWRERDRMDDMIKGEVEMKGDVQTRMEKQQKKDKRQRNTVREHQEQPSHLTSANTLHCHCERELVHSSDSLKRCQGGEGGRAKYGEGDRH